MRSNRITHLILAAASMLVLQSAHAQKVAAGKKVFTQCIACHSTDGSNGAGPSLKGVIGRKVGSVAGFRYSRAMMEGETSWDAKSLDAYIADPVTAIPGNVMPFSGIPDAKQRADLLAYLATLK